MCTFPSNDKYFLVGSHNGYVYIYCLAQFHTKYLEIFNNNILFRLSRIYLLGLIDDCILLLKTIHMEKEKAIFRFNVPQCCHHGYRVLYSFYIISVVTFITVAERMTVSAAAGHPLLDSVIGSLSQFCRAGWFWGDPCTWPEGVVASTGTAPCYLLNNHFRLEPRQNV